MATVLPVTFRASPLPSQFKGTPQQLLDAMVARLSIEGQDELSFFVTGSVAPTSDVGPWLKNGVTWYVWDVVTGSYIPEIIEFRSLRYIASQTAPDQAIYTFWIELDAMGKAIAIKYYSGGAWKDVYEDKFAAVPTNASQTAAIAAQAVLDSAARNQYPFRAHKQAANQTYTAGTGDVQIVFDFEDFDPSSKFAANAFVAPATGFYKVKGSAYISLASGTPTGIDRQLKIRKNGFAVTRKNIQVNDITGGATVEVSDLVSLTIGDSVDIVVNIVTTGASTWTILADSTNTFFNGFRVLTA